MLDDRPTTALEYSPESVKLVRSASLYLATKLGDLLEDVVIVGGLVPSLIIPQADLPEGGPSHVGTMDVDLGLAVGVLDTRRYHEICHRLRNADFRADVNEDGNPTSQRWKVESERGAVTVDFLIPPSDETDQGGKLRNLERGFAAIITPGLELAFVDRQKVTLRGVTIRGEHAQRDVWVGGAGAFVVLKALAFGGRGENKDAYDLVYTLQNYGHNIADVHARLIPLLGAAATQEAMAILERDFTGASSVGAKRVAAFLGDPANEAVRADAAGAVRRLLSLVKAS